MRGRFTGCRTVLTTLLLGFTILLGACGQAPEENLAPPAPALWEIRSPEGEVQGWLFGTIHALPDGVNWKTGLLDKTLARSEMLMVEIADLQDRANIARTFYQMGLTPDQPALPLKVPPEHRKKLAQLLDKANMKASDFSSTETWAAALTLAQASAGPGAGKNGVDVELIDNYTHAPVIELEGVKAQFSVFDSLPEKEQRDLLDLVVVDAEETAQDRQKMAIAWRNGDMDAIALEEQDGLLADPELRQVLLVERNTDWTGKISAALNAGKRPFVAVGGAHMAGPDGLPALLTRLGYNVQRIQ
ncbi:MAG: TraB/GumN family protein [Sphingomonadaceae bacterium]